jgi:hypothetical protein
MPRLFLAVDHANAGRWEQATAATAPLTEARPRLSPYERAWVDRIVAEQRGRQPMDANSFQTELVMHPHR